MKYILTFVFALASTATFSQLNKADTLFFNPPYDFHVKLPELNGDSVKYSIADLRRIATELRKINDSTHILFQNYIKGDTKERFFLWNEIIENFYFSRTLSALLDEGLKRTIRVEYLPH